MSSTANEQAAIIRTERGLSIAGTRITLYDVMDYLRAHYPSKLIRDVLNLTDEQIHTALAYIDSHPTEVEAEYQEVLQAAKEIRQYWEERNRAHFARLAALPPRSNHAAVRAKLQERRMKRELKQQ
jgi:uncharacterized protein (DUF433 family)